MPTFRVTTSATPNTNTRAFVFPLPAGTSAITNGSRVVTGTGTNFLRWLKIGDEIIINNQTRKILDIASDTSLNVDTNFTATASGQATSFTPSEFKKTGNRVISAKGRQANTGLVLIGESRNVNIGGSITLGDGSDVTSTTRTQEVLPTQQVGPMVFFNLFNVYIQSPVASQVLLIDINT